MKELILSITLALSPPQDQFVQVCKGYTPMWLDPDKVLCVHPETYSGQKNGKTVILMTGGEQFMVDAPVSEVVRNLNRKTDK